MHLAAESVNDDGPYPLRKLKCEVRRRLAGNVKGRKRTSLGGYHEWDDGRHWNSLKIRVINNGAAMVLTVGGSAVMAGGVSSLLMIKSSICGSCRI